MTGLEIHILVTVILACALVLSYSLEAKNMIWDAGPFYFFLGLPLVGLLFMFFVPLGRNFSEDNCKDYAVESNFETKFVDYSYFSWDCLAKTDDGKWVPKSNIQIVIPEDK
jgi:hypothetical protein